MFVVLRRTLYLSTAFHALAWAVSDTSSFCVGSKAAVGEGFRVDILYENIPQPVLTDVCEDFKLRLRLKYGSCLQSQDIDCDIDENSLYASVSTYNLTSGFWCVPSALRDTLAVTSTVDLTDTPLLSCSELEHDTSIKELRSYPALDGSTPIAQNMYLIDLQGMTILIESVEPATFSTNIPSSVLDNVQSLLGQFANTMARDFRSSGTTMGENQPYPIMVSFEGRDPNWMTEDQQRLLLSSALAYFRQNPLTRAVNIKFRHLAGFSFTVAFAIFASMN